MMPISTEGNGGSNRANPITPVENDRDAAHNGFSVKVPHNQTIRKVDSTDQLSTPPPQKKLIDRITDPVKAAPSALIKQITSIPYGAFKQLPSVSIKLLTDVVAKKLTMQMSTETGILKGVTQENVEAISQSNSFEADLLRIRWGIKKAITRELKSSLREPINYIVNRLNSSRKVSEKERQDVVNVAIETLQENLLPLLLSEIESTLKDTDNPKRQSLEQSLSSFLFESLKGFPPPGENAGQEMEVQEEQGIITGRLLADYLQGSKGIAALVAPVLDDPVLQGVITGLIQQVVKDATINLQKEKVITSEVVDDGLNLLFKEKKVCDYLIGELRKNFQTSILKIYRDGSKNFKGGDEIIDDLQNEEGDVFKDSDHHKDCVSVERVREVRMQYILTLLKDVKEELWNRDKKSFGEKITNLGVNTLTKSDFVMRRITTLLTSTIDNEELVEQKLETGFNAIETLAKKSVSVATDQIVSPSITSEPKKANSAPAIADSNASSKNTLSTEIQKRNVTNINTNSGDTVAEKSDDTIKTPLVKPEEVPHLSRRLNNVLKLLFKGVEKNPAELIAAIGAPLHEATEEAVLQAVFFAFQKREKVVLQDNGDYSRKDIKRMADTASVFEPEAQKWVSHLLAGWFSTALSSIHKKLEDPKEGVQAFISRQFVEKCEPDSAETGEVYSLSDTLTEYITEEVDKALLNKVTQVIYGICGAPKTKAELKAINQGSLDQAIEELKLIPVEQSIRLFEENIQPIADEILDPTLDVLESEMEHAYKGALVWLRNWLSHKKNMTAFSEKISHALTPVLVSNICANASFSDDNGDPENRLRQEVALKRYAKTYVSENLPAFTRYLTENLLSALEANDSEVVLHLGEKYVTNFINEALPEVVETIRARLSIVRKNIEKHRNQRSGFSRFFEPYFEEYKKVSNEKGTQSVEHGSETERTSTALATESSKKEGLFSKYKERCINDIAKNVANFSEHLATLMNRNKSTVVSFIKSKSPAIADGLAKATVVSGVNKVADKESEEQLKAVHTAIENHIKGPLTDHLSEFLTARLDGVVSYLSSKKGKETIQETVVTALKTDDLQALDFAEIGVMIKSAIDSELNDQLARAKIKISKFAKKYPDLPVPLLKQLAQNALAYTYAKGGDWVDKHQDEIWNDVFPKVKESMRELLKQAQTEVVNAAFDWSSKEGNLRNLIEPLLYNINKSIINTSVNAIAEEIATNSKQDPISVKRDISPIIKTFFKSVTEQLEGNIIDSLSEGASENRESILDELSTQVDQVIEGSTPVIHEAIKDRALVNAARKVEQMDVDKLCERLVMAIPEKFDPATYTKGVVTVDKDTCVPKELSKILCFLIQRMELYKELGGNIEEPVQIGSLNIYGDRFDKIKATLKPMSDGSIRIDKLSFVMPDQPTVHDNLQISASDVSLEYELPPLSNLRRAALLSAARSLSTDDLAAAMFTEYFPNKVHMTAGRIQGGFEDQWDFDHSTAVIKFDLSDVEVDFDIQKRYPTGYMDMNVHAPGKVNFGLSSDGIVKKVDVDLQIDKERNGKAHVHAVLDATRQSKVVSFFAGDISIDADLRVKNGIARLEKTSKLEISCQNKFVQPLCHALIKNTLKDCEPGLFALKEREGHVLKLKPKLFSENQHNSFVNFIAKGLNLLFLFFIPTIKIHIPFPGFSRLDENEDGKIGKFNIIPFVNSLFPWPVSIYKQKNDNALKGISKADYSSSISPDQLRKWIQYWQDIVFRDRRNGHISSANRMLRLVSEEMIYQLAKDGCSSKDLNQRVSTLKILGLLADAEPEKAVSVIHRLEKDAGSSVSIVDFITKRIAEPSVAEPFDIARILPLGVEQHNLRRLLEYYENSKADLIKRKNQCGPEPLLEYYGHSQKGCIYTGTELAAIKRHFLQNISDAAARKVQKHGKYINSVLPPELVTIMDSAFGFKEKLLSQVTAPVSKSPVSNQPSNDKDSVNEGIDGMDSTSDSGSDSDNDNDYSSGYSSDEEHFHPDPCARHKRLTKKHQWATALKRQHTYGDILERIKLSEGISGSKASLCMSATQSQANDTDNEVFQAPAFSNDLSDKDASLSSDDDSYYSADDDFFDELPQQNDVPDDESQTARLSECEAVVTQDATDLQNELSNDEADLLEEVEPVPLPDRNASESAPARCAIQ